MLQLINFSKSFGNKALFNNISLNFHENKLYYIYGENGVGKTTFFRCILGLENFVGAIKKESKEQFCVFDSTPFYLNLTGIDNLAIFSKNKKVQELIKEKEIEYLPSDLLNKVKVRDYSLGEKKILSLILLLLLKPKIILLDEILNGLDQNNRSILFHSLNNLRHDSVILMSGHEKLYMELGDEFLVVRNQKLETIEKNKLSSLFTSPEGR